MRMAITKWVLAGVMSLGVVGFANANTVSLDDYLPNDVSYDPNIPTPKEILGYEVGEWHVRHDQLVRYMEVLSEASDRFELEVTGYTHERRPLLLIRVTAPENHANIETLRQRHLEIADPSVDADPTSAPLVYYMGYSIHGDESSGSNAALLVAYYLAAAQGARVDALLKDNIILLDPSLNPDGLGRFAQWANQHKSINLVADPQHREHVQGTPRGRVNHYWFDLNRDWLLLQHPESRARIANFQKWKPNVLTDFHEMGTDSTFFFQPGIPTRRNPNTPEENVTLTQKLAERHAAKLDEEGRLYFTQQAFDDFYIGKGSTYPDVHGAIGILFEQASSRGHLQDSINGELSFPFTIQNQFMTSLTTLYGALDNKTALLDYQQRFYDAAMEAANDADFDGYLLKGDGDQGRLAGMLNILRQHDIKAYSLTRDVRADGRTYTAGTSYFVPLKQTQYTLIRAIFTSQQSFVDNTFYDVSGWTMPMAFNVDFSAYDGRVTMAEQAWQPAPKAKVVLPEQAYAYAFQWQDYFAPQVLQTLLEENIHVRQAHAPFTAVTTERNVEFASGAVVVTRAYQQRPWAEVRQVLENALTEAGISGHAIQSGLTPQGVDLGSRDLHPVEPVSVLLVMGPGTSMYEVGEAWYYLDRHVGIPVSMIETDRLARSDLSRYTHIIMVDGSFGPLSSQADRLQNWVREGGVLIGQQGGTEWLSRNDILQAELVSRDNFDAKFVTDKLSYADMDSYYGKRRIAGAIFELQLDTSHPLSFGFPDASLPVFKDSLTALQVPETPFITVARYSEEPLISGYAAQENREVLSQQAGIVAHRLGNGRVIGFSDNVNFRAYFWGTAKLLSNAIYLAPAISPSASDEENAAAAEAAVEAH